MNHLFDDQPKVYSEKSVVSFSLLCSKVIVKMPVSVTTFTVQTVGNVFLSQKRVEQWWWFRPLACIKLAVLTVTLMMSPFPTTCDRKKHRNVQSTSLSFPYSGTDRLLRWASSGHASVCLNIAYYIIYIGWFSMLCSVYVYKIHWSHELTGKHSIIRAATKSN